MLAEHGPATPAEAGNRDSLQERNLCSFDDSAVLRSNGHEPFGP